MVKHRENQQLVSIHANIKDPNQACEMSSNELITMLISTSLLSLPPPTPAVQLTVSKSSLCRAQMPLFSCLEDMSECVLNFNRKMCVVVFLFISIHLDLTFPHTVSFNCIVSRLLLSVTAARGAPLSDYDADQRAMG